MSLPETDTELRSGLVLFIMAGDPSLDDLRHVLYACDREGVDFVEVAVPFPDSPTDGPVIRAAADRALQRQVSLEDVLAIIREVRPLLRHTRVILLADWAWSIRPVGLDSAVRDIAVSGAHGVLFHALPPVLRDEAERLTAQHRLGIVTTCYLTRSNAEKLRSTAAAATSYVYLVSTYGRSGGALEVDAEQLSHAIATLQKHTDVPVAVGFGVRQRSDVDQVLSLGADAAVVGTACVNAMHDADVGGAAEALVELVHRIRPENYTMRQKQSS